MTRLKKIFPLAFATGAVLLFIFLWQSRSSAASPKKPRLTVILIVDQMRPDYLNRFRGLYSGGFARLIKEGATFPRVYHDFAFTEISPGHATLATGVSPARHGIVANYWFDREEKKTVYSCGDSSEKILGNPEKPGRSPRRLLAPTLGNWLKKESKKSKIVSVALKDRSAILIPGREPSSAVFWYSPDSGNFVTSTYYAQKLPLWVESFNSRRLADSVFFNEKEWKKLLPFGSDSLYLRLAGPDTSSWEYRGLLETFPHPFPSGERPGAKFYREFAYTPFGDELTLEFAREAVRQYELGKDKSPDLLAISLSAADLIGHRYGPNSQEIMDYYLRLDRYLDRFFEFLDGYTGPGNYFVALSSDHGDLPLPPFLKRPDPKADRPNLDSCLAQIHRKDREAADFLKSTADLFLPCDRVEDCQYGVNLSSPSGDLFELERVKLRALAAARLRELDFLADVYSATELLSRQTPPRPYLEIYRRSFHPQRGPDFYFRFKKYMLFSRDSAGTSHGSPYEYDTHVPIVLAGPGIIPGIYFDSVRTVDFAPTVFEFMGYNPPQDLEGVSLAPKILGPKNNK